MEKNKKYKEFMTKVIELLPESKLTYRLKFAVNLKNIYINKLNI